MDARKEREPAPTNRVTVERTSGRELVVTRADYRTLKPIPAVTQTPAPTPPANADGIPAPNTKGISEDR